MATSSSSDQACNTNDDNSNSNVGSLSYFQKTVCLHDWWLVKSDKDFEGKRLAVAGLTSRELQAKRVFTSAPIIKRYDVFTLETADGICVVVKGFINKLRTNENGFSTEVFNHFLFGFPLNWEEYAENCLGDDFSAGVGSEGISDSKRPNLSPVTSVAGMRDPSPISTPSKCEEVIDIKDTKGYSDKKSTFDASKGGMPQENSNKLAGSPSGHDVYDLKTEVGERESSAEEEGSSRKKIKRKINFDTHSTQGSKEKISIVSPASLNLKRSRAGRVLLPALDFWRNQIAVYDADRRLTGIQETLNVVKPFRGSRSEPQKKCKNFM